jgi:hypothetical protein
MASLMDDQQSTVIGRLGRNASQAGDACRGTCRARAASTASHGHAQPMDSKPTSRVGGIGAGAIQCRRMVRSPASEFSRLLPWRRRALNGAMIAALRRQAEVARAGRRHSALSIACGLVRPDDRNICQRRQGAGGQSTEVVHAALNAIASDWQQRWDYADARAPIRRADDGADEGV